MNDLTERLRAIEAAHRQAMSSPHDREPIDKSTIDCWRINYGLDCRSPADAARYWAETPVGMAPAGAVAALGVVLDELDSLRNDAAAAVAAERERCAKLAEEYATCGGSNFHAWFTKLAAAIRA